MGVLKYLIKYFQVPYLFPGISMEIQELWVFRALSLFLRKWAKWIWSLMPEMPSDVRAQPIFWFTRNFGLHEILGILEILGCTYWLLKKRKSDVVTACLELQFLHQPQSFIRGHVSPPRRENCIKPRQMMHSFMLCIFRKYLKVFKSFMNIFHVLRYLLQHKHRLKGETRERAFSRPSPCVRNELL